MATPLFYAEFFLRQIPGTTGTYQGYEEVQPGNGGGQAEGDKDQDQPQQVLSLQVVSLRHPAHTHTHGHQAIVVKDI